MAEAIYLGNTVDEQIHTAAAAFESGDILVALDGRAGVVMGLNDVASGDKCKIAVSGRFRCLAATGTTFAVGVNVDWDDTTKLCVADAGGDFALGKAEFAKGSGVLYVDIVLNGQGPTT